MLLSIIDLLNVKVDITSELIALTAPLKFKTADCAFALAETSDRTKVLAAILTSRFETIDMWSLPFGAFEVIKCSRGLLDICGRNERLLSA